MPAKPAFEVQSLVTDAVLVQKRRAQIIAAAVDLFSRQGYYKTTIQDVAKKAGVSAGLIYQYVRDKEDVLLLSVLDVLESYKQEIPTAIQGLTDPLERFQAAIYAYCRVVDQRREATVLAYRSTKSLSHERRQLIMACEIETNALIAQCLRDCIEAGLFRQVDVDLVTYHFVSLAHSWALKYWRLSQITNFERYVREGFDFLVQGLLTDKGKRKFGKAR
ncbi:MAG: TetR/AcrR family transcriptional regulator [Alphaproteobacteria bacterium]|nr:TetR/AcrR family transcriptional regulator [Alphaproteobacteria bacterium]